MFHTSCKGDAPVVILSPWLGGGCTEVVVDEVDDVFLLGGREVNVKSLERDNVPEDLGIGPATVWWR